LAQSSLSPTHPHITSSLFRINTSIALTWTPPPLACSSGIAPLPVRWTFPPIPVHCVSPLLAVHRASLQCLSIGHLLHYLSSKWRGCLMDTQMEGLPDGRANEGGARWTVKWLWVPDTQANGGGCPMDRQIEGIVHSATPHPIFIDALQYVAVGQPPSFAGLSGTYLYLPVHRALSSICLSTGHSPPFACPSGTPLHLPIHRAPPSFARPAGSLFICLSMGHFLTFACPSGTCLHLPVHRALPSICLSIGPSPPFACLSGTSSIPCPSGTPFAARPG